MQYENLFFDLDGTLTDPEEGITNSVAYALGTFGIEVADRSALRKFIGPPLLWSFHEYYGFSEEKSREALKEYRVYFTDRGMLENAVIPGIPEMLETLKKAGKKLYVATSKPEPFAREILSHFGLLQAFIDVVGATMDEKLSEKTDIIAYALRKHGIQGEALEKTVMIGDRKHDIEGGKANGIQTVGVLFGYGDLKELKTAGADRIAASPEELERILMA